MALSLNKFVESCGRQPPAKCAACGVPWDKHLGIAGTCLNRIRSLNVNKQLNEELQRAKAENLALKVLIEDAKKRWHCDRAFRFLMYLSILRDGQEFTLQNLLMELKKIRTIAPPPKVIRRKR